MRCEVNHGHSNGHRRGCAAIGRPLGPGAPGGEEITIAEAGQPVAMIIPATRQARQRAFGMFKGQVWMSDDFNAPLSEEELREWER